MCQFYSDSSRFSPTSYNLVHLSAGHKKCDSLGRLLICSWSLSRVMSDTLLSKRFHIYKYSFNLVSSVGCLHLS
jgi:hypothetical protein